MVNKIKVVIFGKNGQLSSEFDKIISLDKQFEAKFYSSSDVDFSNLEKLKSFLENIKNKPEWIINCAAYTNVDKAEDEKEKCNIINNKAVAIIANYCKENEVKLIHYSTDYVFDGSGDKAFTEDNVKNLNPVNYYGKTKLWSENNIINSQCDYIIIRASWIYSLDLEKNNFVTTIKELAKEKEILSVVDDQIGSPTSVNFIVLNTINLIKQLRDNNKKFVSDIYHLNDGKFISWYQFAVQIINDLRLKNGNIKVKKIIRIKSSEYKNNANRPLNSRLDNSRFFKRFGLK